MRLSVAEVAAASAPPGGAPATVIGDTTVTIDGFANDSRSLVAGECFVAVRADRDGHDFVDAAFAGGAAAALVATDSTAGVRAHAGPLVAVDDPVAALARIAGWARRERLAAARVVGITGSTGKTSTKDLLVGAVYGSLRTHANRASFNNEIGLPVTILGAPIETEVLVCEMGARFAGNITQLCTIARPDYGVITNIGTAHAEHLGGAEGVERVKGELMVALTDAGTAVLNADDAATPRLAAMTSATVLTAGVAPTADVRVHVRSLDHELRAAVDMDTPWGRCSTRLGLSGAHQATNAGLAAAVALHLGVAIEQVAAGLSAARGSSWRMELRRTAADAIVLNDAYNANPQSMRAAIRALADLRVGGRRVAVLGAMRELGESSGFEHAAIGEALAAARIDRLVAVIGPDPAMTQLAQAARAGGVEVVEVATAAEAENAVGDVRAGDAVLVKASRAVGLEAVAAALLAGSGCREVGAR